MPKMVRWVAASLALISLCTPAIGKDSSEASCTGPELPGGINMNKTGLTKLTDLNSVKNVKDFANVYGIELLTTENDAELDSSARQGEMAQMAFCKPELQTVKLNLPHDAEHIYYPTCVRLDQCGGCCPHPLLACGPTKTEPVVLKILKTPRNGPGSELIDVKATKHNECFCDCKIKEEDCNPDIHDYCKRDCACVCKDKEKKKECEKQQDIKQWINKTCTCECRRVEECGSGEQWNPDTCQCDKN